MARTEALQQIMKAQADLMDAIVETLNGTQYALVLADAAGLEHNTGREEELLHPFHDLEDERMKHVRELTASGTSLAALLDAIPAEERSDVQVLVERIRNCAARIVALNAQNVLLIRNAKRFVQETLRIITDDRRHNIVDERI